MSDETDIEVKAQATQGVCRCPFCNEAMLNPFPFCASCGVRLNICPSCCRPIPQDSAICPECGASVRE